jgi:NTP pyrophosphatase (non-canonical NTP hydrolase)
LSFRFSESSHDAAAPHYGWRAGEVTERADWFREGGWNAAVEKRAQEATMGYGCQKEFHLNDFHRANYERQREAFAPPHPLMALVACVQEEVGELAAAVLGVTGEKKRKAHLTNADVLDAVADAMTYLSLVASNVGCMDLEKLLGETFNMVSDRAGSKIKVGV